MNLKRATVVLSSLLLVPLVTGALNGCSFDFSTRYECQDPSARADAADAGQPPGSDACGDASVYDAQVDSATNAVLPDAGGDWGFPAWIVPVLFSD